MRPIGGRADPGQARALDRSSKTESVPLTSLALTTSTLLAAAATRSERAGSTSFAAARSGADFPCREGPVFAVQMVAAVVRPSPTLAIIWVYLSLYVIAFAVAYPAIARVVHGLRGGRALCAGWASFVVYQTLLFVFVR